MSNSSEILKELGKTCKGNHIHGHLVNNSAKTTETYTPTMCSAICKGYMQETRNQHENTKYLMNVGANDTVGEIPEHEENFVVKDWAWDDVSHKVLDEKGVKDARREEM